MRKKYPGWLDGYGRAVYEMSASVDTATIFPFDGFALMPLYADLWIDYLFFGIEKFNNSNLTIEKIINSLPLHSSLKFNLFELAFMFKTAKTNHQKVKTIVDFFVKAIEYRAVNRQWWNDNIIKDYVDVASIAKQKRLMPADLEVSKVVAKITAGCGMLVHGLYNDYCTDFGYDVFGPYPTSKLYGKGSNLFVKEFPDLNPIDIWTYRKEFPYKRITVFSVYRSVQSKSFYIGCHMDYKQNLVDRLSHFQVEIDGQLVNGLKELNKVKETIFKDASEHFSLYKKSGFEKQKEVWMWQMCYQFKKFFDFLGLDWKPTKEMLRRVNGKKLVELSEIADKFTFKWASEILGTNYLKDVLAKNV